jgi:hypothetical protein
VILGCYGGNTDAGAWKNEDAALIWCDPHGSWEFVLILDAHNTSESAELILRTITIEQNALVSILNKPINQAVTNLSSHLTARFQSPAFKTRCQFTTGETACLIAARKDQFLWWMSIGDCSLFLFHPELARFGQYGLNQRNHFEWIGSANSFSLPVACFTSGVREFRSGKNLIVLATDGVLEAGSRRFENPETLYRSFTMHDLDPYQGINRILAKVHDDQGVDSATMIGWIYESDQTGLRPSPVK